jgi:hypothetical protein
VIIKANMEKAAKRAYCLFRLAVNFIVDKREMSNKSNKLAASRKNTSKSIMNSRVIEMCLAEFLFKIIVSFSIQGKLKKNHGQSDKRGRLKYKQQLLK